MAPSYMHRAENIEVVFQYGTTYFTTEACWYGHFPSGIMFTDEDHVNPYVLAKTLSEQYDATEYKVYDNIIHIILDTPQRPCRDYVDNEGGSDLYYRYMDPADYTHKYNSCIKTLTKILQHQAP